MTLDKVKEMLADQLGIDIDKITDASRVVEDLGADSLDIVELLMALEDEFGITVPDDKTQDLATVGDIVNLIDSIQ